MTPRRWLTLGLATVLLAACDPDTVSIGFEPTPGAVYGYQSTVTSETTRILDGEDPATTRRISTILATQEVIDVDGDDVRVDVEIRRDGEAPRRFEVRFDRGAQLTGIDLIDGIPLESVGQQSLGDLFTAAVTAPDDTEVRPGDTWDFREIVRLPGDPFPVALEGSARVVELGVIDGFDTATVESELTLPVRGRTQDTRTSLAGRQTVTLRVSYSLDDGSVVEATSTTVGTVDLEVQPPLGVIGPPIDGILRYEISTSTRRVVR